MDIGNLLINGKIYPLPALSFEAIAVPYYRSSVLLIGPIPLPSYVSINQINSLITTKDVHLGPESPDASDGTRYEPFMV